MRSALLFGLLSCAAFAAHAQAFTPTEILRWNQQAQQVRIVRDTWGIAHVSGTTDADAVFGLLYAQCEDDFARVEDNYIEVLGRRAEVEGETALYADLRQRLFMDSTRAVAAYQQSPPWLKQLLDAFAAGTNYYLATHPTAQPRLLHRFQPWMPLLFSEGSIGGNISVVPVERLKAFYSQQKSGAWQRPDFERFEREPVGSNGFAIAPAKSASGHALLLINPHTSFYFRSEVQMTSQAGLNAYGAVTWGQFFIYQGFNESCGWMHTSSSADSMDEYLETITKQPDGSYTYRYNGLQKPVQAAEISIAYKKDGQLLTRKFTTYRTEHGPVVGEANGQWLTVKMMNDPLAALQQSYLRTKATDYASFQQTLELEGNASNNTVFADKNGTIAYWHGNFMPRRPAGYDWSRPVPGRSDSTEWLGLHPVSELVQVKNPASGFIQNCNSTPYTVAGPTGSPDRAKYPSYMAPDAENYRGINAVRVLSRRKSFTLDTLIAAANDSYLAGFEKLLPALLDDYQLLADSPRDPFPQDVQLAIETLRDWDLRYSQASVAQTVAIYWGERILRTGRGRVPAGQPLDYLSLTAYTIAHTTPEEKTAALTETLAELTRDFGKWQTPWGEVNRYQRLTGRIQETYDDKQPSRPVAFASSAWGSLAAFGAHSYPGTKRRYGNVGNSFVAVVEFGPRVVARSVVTGGSASRPDSPHFTDQAPLYTQGQFKDIWFYPEDVARHVERSYQPGE
jgi:acyl-homoserine lactone acylase PvdQ